MHGLPLVAAERAPHQGSLNHAVLEVDKAPVDGRGMMFVYGGQEHEAWERCLVERQGGTWRLERRCHKGFGVPAVMPALVALGTGNKAEAQRLISSLCSPAGLCLASGAAPGPSTFSGLTLLWFQEPTLVPGCHKP